MAIKALLSIILTVLLAYILWLLFSGTLVLGMNRTVSVLFWTILVAVFFLNVWIITRAGSKQIVTILFVCLAIGAIAPYFLATNHVRKMDANENRRYVDRER
jgi:preprotein translocase subunit SecF